MSRLVYQFYWGLMEAVTDQQNLRLAARLETIHHESLDFWGFEMCVKSSGKCYVNIVSKFRACTTICLHYLLVSLFCSIAVRSDPNSRFGICCMYYQLQYSLCLMLSKPQDILLMAGPISVYSYIYARRGLIVQVAGRPTTKQQGKGNIPFWAPNYASSVDYQD